MGSNNSAITSERSGVPSLDEILNAGRVNTSFGHYYRLSGDTKMTIYYYCFPLDHQPGFMSFKCSAWNKCITVSSFKRNSLLGNNCIFCICIYEFPSMN